MTFRRKTPVMTEKKPRISDVFNSFNSLNSFNYLNTLFQSGFQSANNG